MVTENLAGLAVAGLIGGAVARQLTGRRGDEAPGSARGPMESVLGGVGHGVGRLAGSGLRTASSLSGAAVRGVGRAGAATIETTIPATTAGAGWILDGAAGLVVDTGRNAASLAARIGGAGGSAARTAADAVTGDDEEADARRAERAAVTRTSDSPIAMVVRSTASSRFHRPECRMVASLGAPLLSRDEAVSAALAPCGICRP